MGPRKRDFGLGSARELSRDDAEAKVQKLREMARRGEDPIDAKRANALDKALSITFEQCARNFRSQESGWSASHKRVWLADLERDVLPIIGNVPVDRITVKEVLAAIEPHWVTKHETASRNRGRIEKVLDHADAMRHRTSEVNPARWRGSIGMDQQDARFRAPGSHVTVDAATAVWCGMCFAQLQVASSGAAGFRELANRAA